MDEKDLNAGMDCQTESSDSAPADMPKSEQTQTQNETAAATGSSGTSQQPPYGYQPPYYMPYPPQGYAQNGNGQVPPFYPPYMSQQSAPEPPQKKKKKYVSRGAFAAMLVICILLSGATGFAASYMLLAGNHLTVYKMPSSTTVVYRDTSVENGEQTIPASDSFESAAEIGAKSVVEVTTETAATSDIFGQYVVGGAGSGVIISEDGYIITCNHIVAGASLVTVKTSDGQSFEAEIVGADSVTDVAVIKINATGLPAAVIGDSDSLRVAQSIIAIGNPLGELGGSVTTGSLSALNRRVEIDGNSYDLLQTDVAINPGNSGGGLFDLSGRLIGVVNAKSVGEDIEGIGFAIPINSAMRIAEELMSNGYVSGRPALGVYVVDYNAATDYWKLRTGKYGAICDYLTDYGIYFAEFAEGQTGELVFGDRIVAVDDVQVSSRNEMVALLNESYHVGDTVTLTVVRYVGNDNAKRKMMVDVQLTLIESAG